MTRVVRRRRHRPLRRREGVLRDIQRREGVLPDIRRRGGGIARSGVATHRTLGGRRANTATVEERFADVGRGIRLCYSERGDPTAPTALLIMGLGLSMDWWRDEFCDGLVARGLRALRFDNRDVGRSTRCAGPGISAWGFLTRRAGLALRAPAPPRFVSPPVYTLADMADDAAGLARTVAPEGVHVVGVSLGALVAQEVAVRHPDTTLSLTSIMGRPGDGRTGKVSWRRVPDFLRPPGRDPVEDMVRSFRRIGSRFRTAQDDEDVRVTVRRAVSRTTGDDGAGRQLAACVAERDRTADLGALRMPALVVHGTVDRVIAPSGGRATAAAIPRATLLQIPDMGHDLARASWPPILDGIAALTRM